MNDKDYVFKIMVPRSAENIEDGDVTKISDFFIVGEVPVSEMLKDEAAHDENDEASVEVHDEAKVTFEYRGCKTAIPLNNVETLLQPPTDVHSEQNNAILCMAVSEALQHITDETWTPGSNVVPFRRRRLAVLLFIAPFLGLLSNPNYIVKARLLLTDIATP